MYSIKKFDINQEELILSTLNEDGIVLINKILTEEDLLNFSKIFGKIFYHPHSNENGITYIEQDKSVDNRNVDSGFTSDKLLLHTDRGTSSEIPPKYLLLYCEEASIDGGESILVDGYKVLNDLENSNETLVEYFFSNNECIYDNGCEKYSGAVIDEFQGEYILRIYLDKRVVKDTFYYLNLEYFNTLLNKYKFEIVLKKNQALIINNWRFIHGRNKFKGFRKMLRVLFHYN